METTICILLAIITTSKYVDSANWAQASGYIDQNVVIPSIPSPTKKHWQARYGFASLVFPNVSNHSFFRFKFISISSNIF